MDGHAEAEGQKRRVRPLQQLVNAVEAGFGDFPQGVPLRLPDGQGEPPPALRTEERLQFGDYPPGV